MLGAGMVTLLLSNALTTSRINQLTIIRATRGRGRSRRDKRMREMSWGEEREESEVPV